MNGLLWFSVTNFHHSFVPRASGSESFLPRRLCCIASFPQFNPMSSWGIPYDQLTENDTQAWCTSGSAQYTGNTWKSQLQNHSPATGLHGNFWVCGGVEGLLSLSLWQHQHSSTSSSSETCGFSVFLWGWRAPTGFAIRAQEPEFTQKKGQKGRCVYLSGHIAYPLETPEITGGIMGRRTDASSLTQRSLSLQVYRWRHFTGPRHCPTAVPVISWWRDGLRHWYRWASLFPN